MGILNNDSLGNRIKAYEGREHFVHMPRIPIVARMDGRSFSRWTRGLKRPYDERLSRLMIEITKRLIDETDAVIGYTQSDEITLIFVQPDKDSQFFFDGKHDKIVSILGSLTTAIFNFMLSDFIPEKVPVAVHDQGCDLLRCHCGAWRTIKSRLPQFDARAFSVPNLLEAANCLVWREQDATRNSVTMAAQHYYSHKELHGKRRSEKMDMLMSKNVNWNDYPAFFKRGTYLRKVRVERPLNEDELAKQPVKYRDPSQLIVRSEILEIDMPPYSQIEDRVSTYFPDLAGKVQ